MSENLGVGDWLTRYIALEVVLVVVIVVSDYLFTATLCRHYQHREVYREQCWPSTASVESCCLYCCCCVDITNTARSTASSADQVRPRWGHLVCTSVHYLVPAAALLHVVQHLHSGRSGQRQGPHQDRRIRGNDDFLPSCSSSMCWVWSTVSMEDFLIWLTSKIPTHCCGMARTLGIFLFASCHCLSVLRFLLITNWRRGGNNNNNNNKTTRTCPQSHYKGAVQHTILELRCIIR